MRGLGEVLLLFELLEDEALDEERTDDQPGDRVDATAFTRPLARTCPATHDAAKPAFPGFVSHFQNAAEMRDDTGRYAFHTAHFL
jgi:hypothetical protein